MIDFCRRSSVALLLIGGLSMLCACGPSSSEKAAAAPDPAPTLVSTVEVKSMALPRIQELPGRLVSTRVAEVRAQISGIVLQRAFVEGSHVEQGDVLFRINPAVYKAELDSRAAALDRAEATRIQAAKQSERTQVLLEKQATSNAQGDVSVATLRQAEADVASAKAQLERAQINLDYTIVRAPISGRIGRALVSEGALVGQSEPTHLATIQQIDPIYVDFTQSVSDPTFMGASESSADTEVRLICGDGTLYPEVGRFLFSDVSVDPGHRAGDPAGAVRQPAGGAVAGNLCPGAVHPRHRRQGDRGPAASHSAQQCRRSAGLRRRCRRQDRAEAVAHRPADRPGLGCRGGLVAGRDRRGRGLPEDPARRGGEIGPLGRSVVPKASREALSISMRRAPPCGRTSFGRPS
jgi:membrane fusion protein (multidrug efflux system)